MMERFVRPIYGTISFYKMHKRKAGIEPAPEAVAAVVIWRLVQLFAVEACSKMVCRAVAGDLVGAAGLEGLKEIWVVHWVRMGCLYKVVGVRMVGDPSTWWRLIATRRRCVGCK
jgi:hypothetical protein